MGAIRKLHIYIEYAGVMELVVIPALEAGVRYGRRGSNPRSGTKSK